MTLANDLDNLSDDLWMMAQCPRLNPDEKAELLDAADRCANARWTMRHTSFHPGEELTYSECDTIRSKHLGLCLLTA